MSQYSKPTKLSLRSPFSALIKPRNDASSQHLGGWRHKLCIRKPNQFVSFHVHVRKIHGVKRDTSGWSRPSCGVIGRAGALTIQSQAAVLSLNCSLWSEAAAAGSGWAPSGHGLVSADWLAGRCCKIPAPGRQMETNTAAAAVRFRGRVKLPYIMISLKTGLRPSQLNVSN